MSLGWEQALLGTVLADPQAMVEVADLGAQDFGSPNHQIIMKHIHELAARDGLSKVSLIELLKATGELDRLGDSDSRGEQYIVKLLLKADSSGIAEFGHQVREASAKRRLQIIAKDLAVEAQNGKASADIVDQVMSQLMKMRIGDRSAKPISYGVAEQKQRIIDARDGKLPDPIAPYLGALKEIIPGYFPADFAIFAARPGSGKSSLLRYESLEYALGGKRVLLLTNENTFEECQVWANAQISGVAATKIFMPKRLSEKEAERVQDAWDKLENLPWYVEELSGAPLSVLSNLVRKTILQREIEIVMVDGAYLMGGRGDSTYEIISRNMQGLRTLAQEIHRPIIATTQFNRGVANKKEAEMDDLLYAGENPARIIVEIRNKELSPAQLGMFPENLKDGKLIIGKRTPAGVITANVIKQTNGEIGQAKVRVLPLIQRHSCTNSIIVDDENAVSVTHRGDWDYLQFRLLNALKNVFKLSFDWLQKVLDAEQTPIEDFTSVLEELSKQYGWTEEQKTSVAIGTEGQETLGGLVNGISYAAHEAVKDPSEMITWELLAGKVLAGNVVKVPEYA
jgi:replicative DNA helicase